MIDHTTTRSARKVQRKSNPINALKQKPAKTREGEPILLGRRIYDCQGERGGIVLLSYGDSVAYWCDASAAGICSVDLANSEDCVLMDCEGADAETVVALLDRCQCQGGAR